MVYKTEILGREDLHFEPGRSLHFMTLLVTAAVMGLEFAYPWMLQMGL